jgi:gliding motility-associated protein GldL
MGFAQFTQGKAFKQIMSKLYGFGAAIVIVGALFKIQHWEGAGIMLTVGLLTEAVIFFFSAFEPPHEEVDWSLVYPELAGMHEPGSERKKPKTTSGDPVAQYLDKLMADAKVGPELIQSLGTGLKSLGENTAKMATLSNAAVATEEYSKNVAAASKTVSNLTASYEKVMQTMNGMSTAQQELLNNLSNTVEDTKKYKEEVSKLAKNLSSLNTVYGNMLTAMNVGK